MVCFIFTTLYIAYVHRYSTALHRPTRELPHLLAFMEIRWSWYNSKYMSKSPWKTLDSSYVFENPWYKVRQDRVIRPDGKEGTYSVVEKGPSVFVIAITASKEILLVNLFRYTTGHEGWEVPCGGVNTSESLLDAAKRELKEETGCIGNSWQNLGAFDSMNGITNGVSHVFMAQDITWTNENEQTEEGITKLKAFSIKEIFELIQTGAMNDGLSIATLMKLITSSQKDFNLLSSVR